MTFVVDKYRKVTVSLGGQCALACAHCYTMTTQFRHEQEREPAQVVEQLITIGSDSFDTICVSGDTDCFIDEAKGVDLLTRLVDRFEAATIMFTTRLVLSDSAISSFERLASICIERKQLLIPCISVVTYTYPNRVEVPKHVPPTIRRLEFMRRLRALDLPCVLTMRPTFPFSIVPRWEVASLIAHAKESAVAALGEVFLFDNDSQIERRLELEVVPSAREGMLTFLDQPAIWRKAYFRQEVEYAQQVCASYGMPYFLRSPTVVTLFKRFWNFETARLTDVSASSGVTDDDVFV